MAFAGFAQNHMTKYQFGLTKEELLPLAGGIATVETDFDEDTDEAYYYDGGGAAETISKGQTYPFNFEGNRKYADEAQELIRDMLTKNQKAGWLEVTEPDGRVLSGPAVVSAITPFGGDANERSDFKFTISFSGAPTDTKAPTTEQAKLKTK